MRSHGLDAAGNVQVRLDAAEGSRLPSDLYNRSSPPRALPAGGGGGTIAWQSRKRCAVSAVKQRLELAEPSPALLPTAAAASTVVAAEAPTSPPQLSALDLRQPRIDGFFGPREPPAPPDDAMDTSS